MNETVNILLVDDDSRNLDAVESILEAPDHRFVRAQTADSALLALMQDEFAAIVLDIKMPGMSGIELAQLIKQRKRTQHIPIIFLTAYYQEDQDVLQGYGAGAVDYLTKPIKPQVLKSKIAVFVELFRTNRALAAANSALEQEIAHRQQVEDALRRANVELEARVEERTAALQEADRRKDRFLATLAHELRNPLLPIRSAAQLLQLKAPPVRELQWACEVIERQMAQMTRLVDDLLDVSRITRNALELRKERLTLAKVIEDAVETSRPLLEQAGHKLLVTLPPESVELHADHTRLAQVLANLLNNAAKYTEKGGRIWLTAKLCPGEDGSPNKVVEVSVKDTGIGIPPEILPSVFEMFVQVDRTRQFAQGGLGIGLTLVKQLIELHGGTVSALSGGHNQGSEFIVRLPATVNAAETLAPIKATATPTRTKLRILVVDDNVDSAQMLGKLLELMGNEIFTAYDGEEAVHAAARFHPHLILLDIGLPKLNGYETAQLIRSQPWGKGIVLIALTGWGQEEDVRRSREAGIDHHLVKPFNEAVFAQLLASVRPHGE